MNYTVWKPFILHIIRKLWRGKVNTEDKHVLVIGLGEIGYNTAEYITSRGLNVDGYDINENAVERALYHEVIRKKATTLKGYDCYVICISTHKPDNMALPYLDGIFKIAQQLSFEGKSGTLVGIESTISKGTSASVANILGHRLHVAHIPHRYYAKEPVDHGVKQLRVLGGCRPCCVEHAKHFYEYILDIPVHIVNSVEVAELSKIIENSYRFLEISFAEEMKLVCDRLEIDFHELREAINTKWNIEILEALDGIGGHCLPKDSQMFLNLSKSVIETSIIDNAKAIDQLYTNNIHQNVTSNKLLSKEVENR